MIKADRLPGAVTNNGETRRCVVDSSDLSPSGFVPASSFYSITGNFRRLSILFIVCWVGLVSNAIALDLNLPTAEMSLGGQTLTLEIAETPATMSRGLMFRPTLPHDHGMLFIWPQAQPVAMWMKDTSVPLSVAFIDADFRILNIADMEPYSLRIHPSAGPAQYALEVNQGWFSEHGIAAGDYLDSLEALMAARSASQYR